jgi:predicted alpha/beta superfamily hydrolase
MLISINHFHDGQETAPAKSRAGQVATARGRALKLIDSLGIRTSCGGRVNTAANRMTPQQRGNGDRRILDIETAFSIDWVHVNG